MIVGALEIQILSDLSRLRKDMTEVNNTVGKTASAVQSAARIMRTVLATVGAGSLITQFVAAADAVQLMDTRLKLAVRTEENFAIARKQVYDISQRNLVSLDATAKVYSRLNPVIEKMGGNLNYTAAVTEALSAGLRVSGASTQEASSVMIQFSQAMSSGVLRGEEFNSVSENGSRVIEALANQLGKTRGELREMAANGKLTADVVGNALVKELEKLRKEAASMPLTVSAAFQRMKNDAVLLADEYNKAGKITETLAKAMEFLRERLRMLVGVMEVALKIAAAYFVAFKGGALVVSAYTTATVALTAAKTAFLARASLVGPVLATITFMMSGATTASFALAAGFTKLQVAAGLLVAAFAGWAIGDWLRENFLEAELAGIALVNGLLNGWELVRFRAGQAWAYVSNDFERAIGTMGAAIAWFLEKFAAGLSALGLDTAARKVLQWSANVESATRNTTDLDAELTQLRVEYDTATASIDRNTGEMADYAIQAFASKNATEKVTGAVKLLDETEKGAKKTKEELAAAEKARVAAALAADAQLRDIAEAALARDQEQIDTTEKQIKTAREYLEQVEYETAALQMTTEERAVANAMRQLEQQGIVKGTLAYDAYIKKIREAVVRREEVQQTVDNAKQMEAELKQISDDIGEGLTDSLFRAFESGRSFFSTLWDGIKNTVKTTVLRVAIQPLQEGLSKGISGMVSGLFSGGAAAGGGGGGGIMGSLSSLGGIAGTMGSMGSIFSAGLGSTLSGGLSSAGAMMSAGMTGSGLMMGLGTVAPYLAAAAAIYSAVKHKATHHAGSVVTTGTTGTGVTGGSDPHQILRNLNKETDTALKFLSESAVGGLNELDRAFGGGGGFASLAKFASDNDDPSIGSFQLTRGGMLAGLVGPQGDFARYDKAGDEGFKQFAADVGRLTLTAVDQIDLPGWAKAQFNKLESGAGMEEFQATLARVMETQAALSGLQMQFSMMGGVFANIAGLSGDALYQLTEFAGGIEAFTAQAAGFVRDYYSQEEQAALQAKSIFDTLTATGLNLAGLDTREEFRNLLESRDETTEQGRQQIAALLSQAESFAQLSGFLAEQQTTLYQLSLAAPEQAILGSLNAQLEAEAAYQSTSTGQMTQLIDDQLAGNAAVEARLAELVENSSLGDAQINGSLTTLNNLLARFDDGDALAVRTLV